MDLGLVRPDIILYLGRVEQISTIFSRIRLRGVHASLDGVWAGGKESDVWGAEINRAEYAHTS
jgi:hypothetical protein